MNVKIELGFVITRSDLDKGRSPLVIGQQAQVHYNFSYQMANDN